MKNSILFRLQFSILFLTLTYITFYHLNPNTILFTNDASLSAAIGKLSLKGKFTFLGPPASMGGRHLGAIFYWYQYLVYYLAGSNDFTACIIDSIIKSLLTLVSIVTLSKCWHKDDIYFILVITTLVFAGNWWWVIRVPWHSNFVSCLSFLCFSMCCFSLKYKQQTLALILILILGLSHNAAIPASLLFLFVMLVVSLDKKANITNLKKILLLIAPSLIFLFTFRDNIFISLTRHIQLDNILTNINISTFLLYDFFASGIIDLELLGEPNTLLNFIFSFLIIFSVYFLFKNIASKNREQKIGLALLVSLPLIYLFALFFIKPQMHFFNTIKFVPILIVSLACSEVLKNFSQIKFKDLRILYCLIFLSLLVPGMLRKLSHFPYFPYPIWNSLGHAEEVAEIIKKDASFSLNSTIKSSKRKQDRQNSYLYFLGEEYYPSMDNAKKFQEFSEFDLSKLAQCNTVYLVTCPGDDSHELQVNKLLRNHRYQKKVSLDRCRTCSECEVEVFICASS